MLVVLLSSTDVLVTCPHFLKTLTSDSLSSCASQVFCKARWLQCPAAPWPLGSLPSSTLMTHLHVATVTYSNSYNLYHTLPGELDWNLSPLSLNTTFQPLAFSLPCSQEGWSLGLLRLPVPLLYSFFTHWLLISLLLFLTRLDSALLHLYSTKWSPPYELFSWLQTYTLSPSSTPTKHHHITHLP